MSHLCKAESVNKAVSRILNLVGNCGGKKSLLINYGADIWKNLSQKSL
jgi:hypothetical protein